MAQKERPDLIILDIGVPARRLHRAGPLAAERSAFLDPGHHPDRA